MDTSSGTLRAITKRSTRHWSENRERGRHHERGTLHECGTIHEGGTLNERRTRNAERGSRGSERKKSPPCAKNGAWEGEFFSDVVLHYHQYQPNQDQCPPDDHYDPYQFLRYCCYGHEDRQDSK